MRSPSSHHEVYTPRDLDDALAFLAAHHEEGWHPLAGGTDLLVGINHGLEERHRWLNLAPLQEEMNGIELRDGELRVGGMASMSQLRADERVRRACPLLGEAAATIGAVQIQNRATVAGNIVNASPAGDTLPVWLMLEAEIELRSTDGKRRVPYAHFATGYRSTVRNSRELVTAVSFRSLEGSGARLLFKKVGTRAAQAISKVVLAALGRLDDDGRYCDMRLALGSVAPITVRATNAEEEALELRPTEESGERAAAALAEDIAPIDDVRSTADYRMQVARNLVSAFVAGHLGTPVD